MSEPITWLPDGIPFSPRFGDRYHSESGIEQARHVFLAGCGLPAAWAGQRQWRILETGFGFGLNFLTTWAAWRADPKRPGLLHFISTEAWPVGKHDLLQACARHPELLPLAQALHDQWWGLLPGVHRLRFDEGRVQLTLCVGDTQTLLRQQALTADAVYLDGFSPECNPDIWDLHTLKAVARCCRRGTRLATWTAARTVREHLAQCGFVVERVAGLPPKRHNIQATFDPHWQPRSTRADHSPPTPGPCLVIGAGLAGAAVANHLARRGWQVQVLDRGAQPAAGASGLPAGLFAPHVSPDDAVLSRLSRAGVRATLHQAQQWLQPGIDWAPSGVLEHCVDGRLGMPPAEPGSPWPDWCLPATAEQLAQAHLPATTVARWLPCGGWIRPPRLVQAQLAQPGVQFQGHANVAALTRTPEGWWQALDATGQVLAQAPLVVVTAGFGSAALLPDHGPLRALRGQVSMGHSAPVQAALPPFPVNGHGNLVPHVPDLSPGNNSGMGWVLGSTFERGVDAMPPTEADQRAAHATHWDKLQTLLPATAQALRNEFEATQQPATPSGAAQPLQSWGAVRCVYPDRLPLVGPIDPVAQPGLHVCTAMGARGLALAQLCAELLVAQLHQEPLPLDDRLAQALAAQRMGQNASNLV